MIILMGTLVIALIVLLFVYVRLTLSTSKLVQPNLYEQVVSEANQVKTNLRIAEDRRASIEEQLVEIKSEQKEDRDLIGTLKASIAQKDANYLNLQEKLSTQKSEVDDLQKKFASEFENLANKIFEEKSTKFAKQNQDNLDVLLKPLGEKIVDFKKKVEEVYTDETKERSQLKGELGRLFELNQQMSVEAKNLTAALKGESKTQGNWGELILETILEKSGLIKDQEYSVQDSFQTNEGGRSQPDVIINLPENRHMVVDSKVTLTAYERYYSVDTPQEKERFLKEHVLSIKNHIKNLSGKNYQSLYQINSPDFVLMFMPIEPAFGLAVQYDNTLFIDAFEKNIVIVSPSTLLATLRIISNIWRQERQNKNAIDIARQVSDLYDKFVGFVDDLQKIGTRLTQTQETYHDAMGKLKTGKGSILNRVESVKKLGIKTTKSISSNLLEE